MKKLLSLIIVTAMITSMLIFTSVFAADEIISSESFEDGMGTWSYWGNAETNKEYFSFSDDASDGKKSLKMLDNSKEFNPGVNSQKFEVTAGATYKATVDYKLVSGSLFGITLRFLNESGKSAGDVREKLKASNEWATTELTGVAPADAVSVIILVAGNKTNECEIYLDNAKLYSTDAPIADVPEKEETSAPDFSDALFADSFENGLDLWKSFSKAGIDGMNIVTTDASDGKSSLHCVDDSDASAPALIIANYVPIEAGKTYTAYCDYKLVSGDSFKLIIRYFDAEKKKVGDKTVISKSADWETISVSLKAPEGSVYCGLLIAGYSNNLGEAYIDNVKLVGEAASNTDEKFEKVSENSIVLYIGSPNALVNGTKTLIDPSNDKVIANTINSRTLVPVRFIAENYGAQVGWDEAAQTVTLTMAEKVVAIVLNKNEIKVNDQIIAIDVPAQTIEGRTMLPLRAFVEQVMGKTIFWDDRGLIVITDEAILDASADGDVVKKIIDSLR